MTKPIITLIIILAAGLGLFVSTKKVVAPEQVACTMEAKQCPDGSYVGRSGPKCEFDPCPTAGGGGTGILPLNSGVNGTIMVGPVCPVMQYPPVEGCDDRPLATKVTISRVSAKTGVMVRTVSGKDGRFTQELAPGNYIINAGEKMLPSCPQTNITVEPNKYVSITISCDSGIR